MISLHFQKICIDTKLVGLLMTISTYQLFENKKCGRFSIRASAIYSWDSIQSLLIKNLSLKNSSSKKD